MIYRCNLNWRHYYFSRQDYTSKLSLNKWIAKLEKIKSRGKLLYICGWLGRKPLLFLDAIEAGEKFFKSNIIFTNATIELPSRLKCTFVVSVPGTKN